MSTFKKAERLCSRKLIKNLYEKGHIITISPFKFIWLETKKSDNLYPAQIAISVPKRNFKKAVERNAIKRKIKEAYRLNKNSIYSYLNDKGKYYIFMLIYIGVAPLTYKEIESKIILILYRFKEEQEN